MNILMFTNTYLPHIGGVANSVHSFAEIFRQLGHQVLIVAPQFDGQAPDEHSVVRVSAIQNFNGSDFSVQLPLSGDVLKRLEAFPVDIVHSHHPFLLGDTALRIASTRDVPLIFTYHTMYERYTHYVPGNAPALRRFVIELAAGYANLCDRVIAPSESIAAILTQRGVVSPIIAVPTGVDVNQYATGDRQRFRTQCGIKEKDLVIGHVGRLAAEKNLLFLTKAIYQVMRRRSNTHFVVVGRGPLEDQMREMFAGSKLRNRVHMLGAQQGQDLVDAYHAMDLFAFASNSETQGMVLVEAMACGLPVVAIDAPGTREVVQDGVNGFLPLRANPATFIEALLQCIDLPIEARQEFARAAKETAQTYSLEHCADRCLKVYISALATSRISKEVNGSRWLAATRRIGAEWDLLTNKVQALQSVVTKRRTRLQRFIYFVKTLRSRLVQPLIQSQVALRLLQLTKLNSTLAQPGLVMIQIDGLSKTQLNNALAAGKMRFLGKLLRRGQYRLHPHYSGIPSTTPAVQGELFYGVQQAVPAFSFRSAATKQIVAMFYPEAARNVQHQLSARGTGLLEGGSAYCDIYSGGAENASFCAVSLGFDSIIKELNPLRLLLMCLLYLPTLLKIAYFSIIEFIFALYDALHGGLSGWGIRAEIKFIFSRIIVTVWMREYSRVCTCLDIMRGVPVIHLNLLGYDEHAHRRGPASVFAHWTLKGIDRAIQAIFRATEKSRLRDYEVWVYSDHGQEEVVPYKSHTGMTLKEKLSECFGEVFMPYGTASEVTYRGTRYAHLYGSSKKQTSNDGIITDISSQSSDLPLLAALGPLAHLYWPTDLSKDNKDEIGRRLVSEVQIPLVLASTDDGKALAWTSQGIFKLPDQGGQVLGTHHPFLEEASKDLAQLTHHPESGTFILCGSTLPGKKISFPAEWGAHAGGGDEECSAFALLPDGVNVPSARPYLRPLDLRHLAYNYLESRYDKAPKQSSSLKVMTYNVHSCIGMDSIIAPARIARVISRYDPDIVALQELGVGLADTQKIDQAQAIASELNMFFHFHPALSLVNEQYGDAILSKYPMQLIKAAALPGEPNAPWLEPRGALWVSVNYMGRTVNIINTHFGLRKREQRCQIDALVGPDWLGNSHCNSPIIVCADLNATPRSYVCKRLNERFKDVQEHLHGHSPQSTWTGEVAIARIDHIFVSSEFQLKTVRVPRTSLTKIASDHLPLIAELSLS